MAVQATTSLVILRQTRKWSELRRALDTQGEAALAAHGLLERGLRQVEYISLPAITRHFPATNLQFLRCHVGSLIEWGATSQCTLSVSPATTLLPADTPITPFLHPDTHAALLTTLQARDISSQGELCTHRRNGYYHWTADTFAQQLRTALGTHAITPLASDTLTLTAGHIYHLPNLQQYYEFHGVLATSPSILLLRAWEPYKKHTHLRFKYSSPAPLLHLPYHSLATQPWRRLLTAPASRAPAGWAHRRILSSTSCSPPQLAQALQPRLHDTVHAFIQDLYQLQRATGHSYSLFTDGSYLIPALPPLAILDSEHERRANGVATAAIVAIGPPAAWQDLPIVILRITASSSSVLGASAYTAELLALTTAVRITMAPTISSAAPLRIYSDCKSAISTVKATVTAQCTSRNVHRTHVLTDCINNVAVASIT